MGLEVDFPEILPEDLNPDWPLGSENLDQGDNHIRLTKRAIINFFNAYQVYAQQNELRFQGNAAKEALFSQDSAKLGGRDADDFALKIGDYAQLRARATTKDDVELGNVDNFPTATAIENNSKKFTPVSLLYQLQQQLTEEINTKSSRKQYIDEHRSAITAFDNDWVTLMELRVSDPKVAGFKFAMPPGLFNMLVTSGSTNGNVGRGRLQILWNGTQVAYDEAITNPTLNNSPNQAFISLQTGLAFDLVANQTNILTFQYRKTSVLGQAEVALNTVGVAEIFRSSTIMTII